METLIPFPHGNVLGVNAGHKKVIQHEHN